MLGGIVNGVFRNAFAGNLNTIINFKILPYDGRVFQIGVWMEISLGGSFYQAMGAWGGVVLNNQTFFKAKNSFLWILNIKIKSSMTCVSKDYESKTKMVNEKWLQLKIMSLLGYINLKIVI